MVLPENAAANGRDRLESDLQTAQVFRIQGPEHDGRVTLGLEKDAEGFVRPSQVKETVRTGTGREFLEGVSSVGGQNPHVHGGQGILLGGQAHLEGHGLSEPEHEVERSRVGIDDQRQPGWIQRCWNLQLRRSTDDR